MITILKDYINQKETSIAVTEDIYILSKMHKVEGILYHQSACAQAKNDYYATVLLYKFREKYVDDIKKIFEENQIAYFFVKGLEVSKYYPQPYLKTMSDSDIVIHRENRDKAKMLLEQEGFLFYESGLAEWKFVKNNIHFELHYALLYEDEFNKGLNDDYPQYFNCCWEYVKDNRLDDSFHFLFMIIHLRKHIFYQGAGFRLFLDMAFFLKADLDIKWIKKQLRQLKLESFAGVVFGLIKAWWGIDSDFAVELPQDVIAAISKKVSDGGVFGNRVEKSASATDAIVKHSVSSYLLSRFFLPYEFFMRDKGFNFMKGRPYLLPIGWAAHLCRSIKRSAVVDDYFRMKLPSKKELRLREEELIAWGLKE